MDENHPLLYAEPDCVHVQPPGDQAYSMYPPFFYQHSDSSSTVSQSLPQEQVIGAYKYPQSSQRTWNED